MANLPQWLPRKPRRLSAADVAITRSNGAADSVSDSDPVSVSNCLGSDSDPVSGSVSGSDSDPVSGSDSDPVSGSDSDPVSGSDSDPVSVPAATTADPALATQTLTVASCRLPAARRLFLRL